MATGTIGIRNDITDNFNFNPISRYQAVTTSGEEVWIVSSSTIYKELAWQRTSTSLIINRTAHGHSIGNMVIVRNSNLEYQTAFITQITTNSFTINTSDSGYTSGPFCSYSLGFTYTHIAVPKYGGTLSAPTGDHADCQLLSLQIRTGSRQGTTYDVIVPTSITNGCGTNTDLTNCFIPLCAVRTDADSLTSIGATLDTNIAGSYSTFRIGNLGTLSRFITLRF